MASMDAVIAALIGAARSLVHPVILVILLVPMLIALVLWIGIGWTYWDTWTTAIQNAVVDHTAVTWAANWDMARLASWIAAALVLAILAPVVIVTLPLWLLGPLAALLPLLLSAYLNQRLFRSDALSDHADARRGI